MITDKTLWLADFLYRRKKATRSQVEQAWRNSNISYGKELNRRTFQETKNKVEHLFDTTIAYNAQTHEYYFEDPDIFQEDSVKSWLLKTLSVSSTLQAYKKMQNRILLEEPATGYFYLSELLNAMETSVKIMLAYHPFNKDSYTTLLSAYCLKVFKQRWYVLGFSSHHQEIRTFALDRIESIGLTETPFSVPAEFDNKLYFQHCYGITYAPHLELHKIIFKVNSRHIPYLRTNRFTTHNKRLPRAYFRLQPIFP
ncbi:helix-turn-helix transcriptional regulator [Bacteroides gallinarum]|uniref:helix-turn-helix transcriptional regulator n=1 Tax=Bacteroides gallinarum TaxID=376806 RepID=UPI0021CD1F04|nr:WYL domain-containing protein [Bacteroides gallinarum]